MVPDETNRFRVPIERHYAGRFAQKIDAALGEGITTEVGGRTFHVIPLSAEMGHSLLHEEIRLTFRLDQSPPEEPPSWTRHPDPAATSSERGEESGSAAFCFTFSSEISVEENLRDFATFLEQHAEPRGAPEVEADADGSPGDQPQREL